MVTLAGIPIDNLTNWSEPFRHEAALVQVGHVTPLYRVLAMRHPKGMRTAGVFLRHERGRSFLVRYLDAPPVPVTERPLRIIGGHERVKVNESGLLSWQPDAVRRLKWHWLRGARNLADLSDTGTGKSYVFLALCRELRRHAFVVTIKNAVHQWAEAAAMMGVPCTVTYYEHLKTGKHAAVAWETREGSPWPRWKLDPQKTLVCFDEAQKGKALDYSLNSKLLMIAAYQKIPHVITSATLATSPVYMRASGYSLGLHRNVDFETWLDRSGCIRAGKQWYFSNDREVMRGIHETLMNTCAVRVRKRDLGDRFPPTVIEPWLMDFPPEVDAKFEELAEAFRLWRERADAQGDGGFAAVQKARMEIEFLKVPAFVEMAEAWAEEGLKVALFFNFDEPIRQASKLLGNAPMITGTTKPAEREAAKQDFQADRLPFICCNADSGGAAISLHGKAERGTLIMPTWKADTLRQVFGRVQRAGGASSVQRVIFARGTVEEEICRNLRAKLNNLDTLNDGDTQGNLLFVSKKLRQ